MKIRKLLIILYVFAVITSMCGCGKSKNEVTYEIVNGQIVEIRPEDGKTKDKESKTKESDSRPEKEEKKVEKEEVKAPKDNGKKTDKTEPAKASDINSEIDNYISSESSENTEDTAVVMSEGVKEYNTIAAESDARIKALEKDIENAVGACHDIYINADKGEGINVSLSGATVAEMITAIGNAGYSAIDSNNDFNMQCYENMHNLGLGVNTQNDVSGSYFIVYSDGHMTGFNLYRENGEWHLLAMSSDIENFRIYQDSKGRYAIKDVRYTERGWLIYQREGDTKYTMVRVLPLDSYARQLCERYIKPVGYLENNLFTTNWDESNMGPIDFNSLYAYLFGMYNGTQMLSSYNVRNYYKAYGGTRIYIVPTDTFETVVTTYFSIDPAVLKSISDFSYSLGGYMFLGYNRDYYNVTPKTPTPEVINYRSNPNGSITMTVDAVNPWYGTDIAFQHELTVYPNGNSFKYVSNTLIDRDTNILPEQKLAAMLDVERSKSDY